MERLNTIEYSHSQREWIRKFHYILVILIFIPIDVILPLWVFVMIPILFGLNFPTGNLLILLIVLAFIPSNILAWCIFNAFMQKTKIFKPYTENKIIFTDSGLKIIIQDILYSHYSWTNLKRIGIIKYNTQFLKGYKIVFESNQESSILWLNLLFCQPSIQKKIITTLRSYVQHNGIELTEEKELYYNNAEMKKAQEEIKSFKITQVFKSSLNHSK